MKLYSISYTQSGESFEFTDYYLPEEVIDILKELLEEDLEDFTIELENDEEE